MRLRKFLSVFIILFSLCGNTVFAENIDNADNYLIGMTVSKVKEGFYTVSLQFKNDTKEQFEAFGEVVNAQTDKDAKFIQDEYQNQAKKLDE